MGVLEVMGTLQLGAVFENAIAYIFSLPTCGES